MGIFYLVETEEGIHPVMNGKGNCYPILFSLGAKKNCSGEINKERREGGIQPMFVIQ